MESLKPPIPVASSGVIQRVPGAQQARGARPPDAAALLAAQYPNLRMPADQLAILDQVLLARHALRRQAEEMKPFAGSDSAEDAGARGDPHYEVLRRNRALVIPISKMLGNDILPEGQETRSREPAFREALYRTLIEYPIIATINEAEPPEPLLTFRWGPNSWELDSDGGRIEWRHLMQVQKWALDYHQALTGDSVEVMEELSDLKKQAGGMVLDFTGKKLGETYGHVWNSTIKVRREVGPISGYGPDADEQKQLNADWNKMKGARLKVSGPDGYIHLFSLDDFSVNDMKEPGLDGYVYLLDKGSEVSGVLEVVTKDDRYLEACDTKDGKGWRTAKELSEIEQFSMGVIIGDFIEDPTATMTVSQVITGCIPIVGQVADARDVAAGIYKMWQTGGTDGKVQTALALVGFVPLLGDGVKSAWRAARGAGKEAATVAAREAFVDGLKGGEQVLAQRVLKNADEVAQAFKLSKEEAKALASGLQEMGARAVKEGGPAARAYVEALEAKLKDLGGNGGSLMTLLGGKWAAVRDQLKSIPGSEALCKELQAWRVAQFDTLERRVVAEAAGDLGSDVAKRSVPPKMERTGTPAFDSDVDVSFLGPAATADRNAAIRAMEAQFGSGWRDLLDADIFADPSRLHMFEGPLGAIGGTAAKRAEKRIVKEAELNILTKMLQDAQKLAPGEKFAMVDEINKMAKDMGVTLAQLAVRQEEIALLSKDYLTGMLKRGADKAEVEKLAKEMGVPFDDVVKHLDNFEDAYRKLEIKQDVLHQQYKDAAGNLPKQAQIAEEMAANQGKLNAAIPGPYVTPGGGAKHVSRREPKLRGTAGYKAMSPAMAYMAVLDDLYMLKHSLPAAGKTFDAKSAKGMAKYGDRLLVTAGQFGVNMSGESTGPLFANMSQLLAGARGKNPAAMARFPDELNSATRSLIDQLDSIRQAVKQNADDYLASGAGEASDVAANLAKAEARIRAQTALISAIKEPTSAEIRQQADQEEHDEQNAEVGQ